MKRTEREIYDYICNKVEGIKNDMTFCLSYDEYLKLSYREEAYEDVLNFIGSIRTNGTTNEEETENNNK